jgi:hypothetical protein
MMARQKPPADMAPEKWMPMAKALIPSVYAECGIDQAGGSVMELFFLLLPKVRDAIRGDDQDFQCRAFAFAEWCMWQNEKDLWNSAGVTFYAHLFDSARDTDTVCSWLSKKVFADIESLLDVRSPPDRVAAIRAAFHKKKVDRSRLAKELANQAARTIGGAL